MNQFPRRNQPIITNECFSSCFDSFLTVRCEGKIRDACVSAVEGPFGFAMSDYEASWGHFFFFLFVSILGWVGDELYV